MLMTCIHCTHMHTSHIYIYIQFCSNRLEAINFNAVETDCRLLQVIRHDCGDVAGLIIWHVCTPKSSTSTFLPSISLYISSIFSTIINILTPHRYINFLLVLSHFFVVLLHSHKHTHTTPISKNQQHRRTYYIIDL